MNKLAFVLMLFTPFIPVRLDAQVIKVSLVSAVKKSYEYEITNNSEFEVGGLFLGKKDANKSDVGELLWRDILSVSGPEKWSCDKYNDTEDVDCYIHFSRADGLAIAPHSSRRGIFVTSDAPIETMASLTYIVSYWSEVLGKSVRMVGKIENKLPSSQPRTVHQGRESSSKFRNALKGSSLIRVGNPVRCELLRTESTGKDQKQNLEALPKDWS